MHSCVDCNSNKVRALVTVGMYINADFTGKLTKKVIARKDTELWFAENDKISFVCSDCGNAWGYGYDYHAKDLLE